MINTLKTIDQSGIKALIKERLENPEKYVNIPLIIWRAPYNDGIQERILEEAFDEYNANMSKDDRKWYRVSFIGDERQISYDFTTPEIIRTDVEGDAYGKYNFGLLVIDPVFAFMRPREQSLDMYYSAINSRKVGYATLLPDVPVVAFMANNRDWFETPEKYPEAEQYLFEPNFDEWAEWALSKGGFPPLFIDFIRGDGDKTGIPYRWYNFFNNTPDGNRVGCWYPDSWNDLRIILRLKMKDAEVDNITALTDDQLKDACEESTSHISDDVKEAFCKYVSAQRLMTAPDTCNNPSVGGFSDSEGHKLFHPYETQPGCSCSLVDGVLHVNGAYWLAGNPIVKDNDFDIWPEYESPFVHLDFHTAVIGKGIKYLCQGCFNGCKTLKTIILHEGMEAIEMPIARDTAVEYFTEGGLQFIGTESDPRYALVGCTEDFDSDKIVVPDDSMLIALDEVSLPRCVKEVELPDGTIMKVERPSAEEATGEDDLPF